MAERPKEPKFADLGGLVDKDVKFEFKSPESPEERQSRLRREEAEDGHKRRISLIVHIFVMTVVAIAFLTSAYIALAGDSKTALPDKAMSIIMAIVAGAFGYLTGKGSK
jgi:hypothetical protein